VMLASTQETSLIKKSTVSSFKLQQASEGKSFCFILACPCICKHLCLKDIEAIYRVVVGASCTLNISFKHTPGDYLDAELRTRKPQEPVTDY
jgi:hypothetical protein